MTTDQETALLTMEVVDSERITPNMVRVTFGGGDVADFRYLGRDQWFRLFLPLGGADSLEKAPNKLTTLSYLKFLAVSAAHRPILRNYTVRKYRAEGKTGPQIDVDFVVHGNESDGSAGPATLWAQRCQPGDPVGVLDEGALFAPHEAIRSFRLAADETALPAAAGVLADLPEESTGEAWIEIPSDADRQPIDGPDGVTINWLVRDDMVARPGQLALDAVLNSQELAAERTYGWVAGEQALAAGARRAWIKQGIAKADISFTGYYKLAKAHGAVGASAG